jgi:3-oxoadipate enol-lactonase
MLAVPATKGRRTEQHMPTVNANGIDLYYEEQGSGEPLLFISGLGGNLLSWSLVLPSFVERHRCIVFDNRGVGRSAVPPGPYTIEQMAADAAALLGAIGVERADCVGVSLGSSVLQALCYRHPNAVRRAVLLSGFPSYTGVQHAWLDANLQLRAAGADQTTLFVANMPWVFTPRLLSDHEGVMKYAALALGNPYPTSVEGHAAQSAGIRSFDSRPHLGEVKAPVLIVVGAEDVLTPVHQSIEMAQLIPNARLVVLPRGGHGMLAEYQDDVVRVARHFLDEPAGT